MNFKGTIKEIPYISIDYFHENKSIYFLSHTHWDHMDGLQMLLPRLKKNLYASTLTIHIIKKLFPNDSKNLIGLEIGIKYPIDNPDSDETLCVTLIPAGHCPGSVMFLFETDKRILYTGDIRLRTNELKKIKTLYDSTNQLKKIDKIYLDTTFFKKSYSKFPMREESLNEFINLLTPFLKENRLIRFEIPALIGSEYLYLEICKYFKTKIHVSPKLFEIYKYIPEISEIITLNPLETLIHVSCHIDGRKNYFCDRITKGSYILTKPAAFTWFDYDYKHGIIEKRTYNNYCVCYSSHCSYEETVEIIKFLKPLDIHACVLPKNEEERKVMIKLIKDLLEEIHGENVTKNKIEENDSNRSDDSWEVDSIKISQESDNDPFAFLNKNSKESERDGDKNSEESESEGDKNSDDSNWKIDQSDLIEISDESDHDPFDILNK